MHSLFFLVLIRRVFLNMLKLSWRREKLTHALPAGWMCWGSNMMFSYICWKNRIMEGLSTQREQLQKLYHVNYGPVDGGS